MFMVIAASDHSAWC